jgi:hypothetical protein
MLEKEDGAGSAWQDVRNMKFLVSIYQDEDWMYIVECPSIPGYVSQGQTEAEAEANAADAIRECQVLRAPNSVCWLT